jgi:transcriptional regulator with XRE-family HTH domain
VTLKKEFALRLRQARFSAGISQWELAKRCAMTQDWVSHLECGRRLPDIETFFNLVRALDVSADLLVVKSNNNNKRKVKSNANRKP